jgi:AcrR family transcriptional regulator
MSGHGQKKEQKQDLAIAALLNSESIRDAAKEAGIAEATLHRYLKDEAFKAVYQAAKRELINHAICRLQRSAGVAVKALKEISEDKEAPASARVSAAKTILEIGMKAIEFDEIEKRIAALEKIVIDQQKTGGRHERTRAEIAKN